MSQIVVHHDVDPGIGILLETFPEGAPGKARGTHGSCTGCGRIMHWWEEDVAIIQARAHVDSHEAVLIGGDTDALIH